MGIKVSNNAFATLAAGISNSATSITLTTGQGARFPTLGAGDYFYATLIDVSNNLEIVKVTARSTDVLTVVRAQEGTTARAYSTGDRIELRITAATFTDAVNEIGPTQVSSKTNTATDYFDLPSGTSAQRPGSPNEGMFRHNTELDTVEFYDSGVWKSVNVSYTVEYLVIAGGGSGSQGGGGAGGYLTGTASVTSGVAYTTTVGAGGAGLSNTRDFAGNDGNDSSFGTLVTATKGGGGGAYGDGGVAVRNGRPGGSGGGGGGLYTAQTYTPGGSGTAGQGYAGGYSENLVNGRAGGGGGAGAVGQDGGSGAAGGAGLASSITGTSVTRGGGGGGGASVSGAAGSGGTGGGGNGGKYQVSAAVAGSANTGGGGGGGASTGDGVSIGGAAGGSGIVIVRYLGGQRGTGGTVTSSGGYTIHTFTSSGAFTA